MNRHTTHWSQAGDLHTGPVDDCDTCLTDLARCPDCEYASLRRLCDPETTWIATRPCDRHREEPPRP